MRPGPIGPGNLVAAEAAEAAEAGFNEARPNWAGKCNGIGNGCCERESFNEARPNWAGKLCRAAARRPTCCGFNEARPNWAGKLAGIYGLLEHLLLLQ